MLIFIQCFEQKFPDRHLVALSLENRDDPVAKLVAMKIIELGQRGERDPERLRDYAVRAFTQGRTEPTPVR